jgi:hypothetical protein
MRGGQPMSQNSGHHALRRFFRNAVMKCVIAHFRLVYRYPNCALRLSQLAQQQPFQPQPHSPLTPTRQPQTVMSSLSGSGPAGPISPFKASTTSESPRLDVPSHSPVEKLEAVKQYLRDRVDQPLHHVEYVGLVSLLKDSVQGPCFLFGRGPFR